MKPILETERLFLRELSLNDIDDLFEMDSDPMVHLYIENNPVQSKDQLVEVIEHLQKQYAAYGIGRWAVVEKESEEVLGWAGLKFFDVELNGHVDFYELGYRFKQKHWGKGYATESARALIQFGFENRKVESIFAITHLENQASIHVLQKLGFEFVEVFDYDGDATNWFELKKTSWEQEI